MLTVGAAKAQSMNRKWLTSLLDRLTKFTGGELELRESINAWNHSKIHEALLQKNTKWIFNPQIGQISEAFGKAVFARSKTRILCGDAGGDKNNILLKLLETMVWRISAPASEQTKMDIAL